MTKNCLSHSSSRLDGQGRGTTTQKLIMMVALNVNRILSQATFTKMEKHPQSDNRFKFHQNYENKLNVPAPKSRTTSL